MNDQAAKVQNEHLHDYLSYFCSKAEPGYAVLVTGAWGSGKTHQVKKALEVHNACYVTLFGMSKADEVAAELFTQMHPKKAWIKKAGEFVGNASASIPTLGTFNISGLSNGLLGALIRSETDKTRPIIFDDLERCDIPPKDRLGMINYYVEHIGCKVIIIAHDGKMDDIFGEYKEKLIGQTLRVLPQAEDAFDAFLNFINDEAAKRQIGERKDEILTIFKDSEVQSLRTLRHVMEDLARLFVCLDERHIKNTAALSEVLALFAAISIDMREGRLKAEDLRGRSAANIRYRIINKKAAEKPEDQPWIVAACHRYSSTDPTSTLLQDDLLIEILVHGKFDRKKIQSSINASPYFIEPENSKPWEIVIGFDKLEDDVVTTALAKMQDQINRREFIDLGELLHIFSLKMLMACKDVIVDSVSTVLAEAKSCVDDLARMDKLPDTEQEDVFGALDDSAHGVMFWVDEKYTHEFRELREYIREAQKLGFEAKFPTLASGLLGLMQTDASAFFKEVSRTNSGSNRLVLVPILAKIPPADFVKAWMNSPKAGWRWIRNGLEHRYEYGELERNLKEELPWISEVMRLLEVEVTNAKGIARLRLLRQLPKIPMPEAITK